MERLSESAFWIKGVVTVAGSWLAARLGLMYPVMGILLLVMAMDFVSAWIAAVVTGDGLQSQKCGKGILKKMGYLLAVAVAMVVDWLLSVATETVQMDVMWRIPISFALLVAVWLILNELISIIENLQKADVRVPVFLNKLVRAIQTNVDRKQEEMLPKEKEDEER